MERATAHGLVPYTNDPGFREHFLAYIEDREKLLLDRLVNCNEIDRIKQIQGSITELRRLKHLNDELIQFLKPPHK